MKVTLQGIKSGISTTKQIIKESFQEAREYNRENNVFKEIKRTVNDVKDCYEKGKVYTAGVTDDESKNIIDRSKSGLEAYAKSKNLNIIFHTPQKPYEVGSNDFQKPLTVSVESKGGFFGDNYFAEKVVDGDVKNTTVHSKQKIVTVGDSQREVTSSYDDTFLRRVFRTVEELAENINAEKKYNKEHSFLTVTKNGIKDDVKVAANKAKTGIKKYCDKKIKFIKDEFGFNGSKYYID